MDLNGLVAKSCCGLRRAAGMIAFDGLRVSMTILLVDRKSERAGPFDIRSVRPASHQHGRHGHWQTKGNPISRAHLTLGPSCPSRCCFIVMYNVRTSVTRDQR
jgi:hypothetical protein